MSDSNVAAVAAKLAGAPEELVVRSANARAQAQGVSVDEILTAWAGGEAIAAAPSPAPTAEPEASDAPVEAAPVEEAAPAAAAQAPAPAAVAVATAVAVVVEEEPEEPVVPAGLGERLRFGAAVGAVLGAVLGIIGMVLAVPLMIDRLDVVGDPAEAAISVAPPSLVLAVAAMSAVFGALVAIGSRTVPPFTGREYALRGSAGTAGFIGAGVGLVLGVVAGGLLVALGEEGLEDAVLLSIRSTLLVVLLGGVFLGAITAAVAQMFGSPATGEDEEEEVVRSRLSNAVMIPLVAAVVIVGFVVPMGMLLLEFPEFAPLLAILVAAGILTFASLMASRPNMHVSRGEFLVALAGIGIVVILIAVVASQFADDGHGGEEEHSEEGAAPIVRLF